MNHRYLWIGVTGLALSFTVSCNRQSVETEEISSVQEPAAVLERLYHRSIELKDYSSASVILLELIDREPAQAGRWKQEQAKAYFNARNFASCSVVAKDVVDHHDGAGDTGLLEMLAISQESIGQKTEAIVTWTNLVEKSANPAYAVRLASLLVIGGDYARAKEVIGKASVTPELEKFNVQVPAGAGKIQNVSVAAALTNLKGLISFKEDPEKNLEAAREAFTEALQKSPDFVVAKHNLASLQSTVGPAPVSPVIQPPVPVGQ